MMKFVKNFYLLYEEKCWSLVFVFSTCFNLAHIVGSSRTLGRLENHRDSLPFPIEISTNVSVNFPKALVIDHKCQVFAFNADDMERVQQFPFDQREFEACTFDMYTRNKIFYSYDPGSILSMPSSNYDLRIPANLNYKRELPDVYDMTVDFVNKKLYLITLNPKQESDKLMVVDMVSGHTAIVMTDLNLPNRIEVDPLAGLLFVQQHTSILRANMDGSSRVTMIKRIGISGLAIERKSKLIFWANPNGIKSTHYHTIYTRLIVSSVRLVRSFAAIGKEIFWISTPYGLAQPNSTVSHCSIKPFSTCDAKSISNFPLQHPESLRAYNFDELQSMVNEKSNPCDNIKSSCQHLCLLKANSYSCACKVGYRLNSDMHTCQLAYDEFLLYVQNNYAKGRIIGSETVELSSFVDAIYPNGLVSDGQIVSFDYDYENNLIFYTDNVPGKNTLYVKKLAPESQQTTIYSNKHKVFSTVSDWISKNIYQLVSDGSPHHNCAIIVHRYSETPLGKAELRYSTELVKFPTDWLAGTIVVHPLRGYIFMTVKSEYFKEGRIYHTQLDGSDFIPYLTDASLLGLAIDLQENKLYWINSNRTCLMSYYFDDRIGIERYDISTLNNATSVSVNSKYVFVGNLTTIWRFDKKDMKNPLKMVESLDVTQPKTIIGTKIYGASAQPTTEENPCSIKNGGCQKFCFAVPPVGDKLYFNSTQLRKQCGCEGDERPSLDGLTCGVTLPQQHFLDD